MGNLLPGLVHLSSVVGIIVIASLPVSEQVQTISINVLAVGIGGGLGMAVPNGLGLISADRRSNKVSSRRSTPGYDA